jgi:hypothetical protein
LTVTLGGMGVETVIIFDSAALLPSASVTTSITS